MAKKADDNSTLSEKAWRAVAETLPAGANRAYMHAELERIKRDRLSPAKLVGIFEERIRQCNQLIQSSPVTDEERTKLEQDALWSKEQVKFHKRMIGEPPTFRKQCAMLWLFQQQGGGDPLITLDSQAVRYFRAASEAVFGKKLSAGHAKRTVYRFRHLRFSAATLPVTITMSTDEAGVFVISADGTKR